MYHSNTPELIKEDINLDLDDQNCDIRVLVATSAAGMCVDFKRCLSCNKLWTPNLGHGCFCSIDKNEKN